MPVTFAELTPREERFCKVIIDVLSKAANEAQDRNFSRTNADMDLRAVHETCPLDFEQLAEWATSDDNQHNFWHDMNSIGEHLNRTTGELEECFVPRSAYPSYLRPATYEELYHRDVVDYVSEFSSKVHTGLVVSFDQDTREIKIATCSIKGQDFVALRKPEEVIRICNLDD